MIPREILHEILQPGGVVVAIATAIFAGSGWQDRKRKAAAGGTTTPAEAAQQQVRAIVEAHPDVVADQLRQMLADIREDMLRQAESHTKEMASIREEVATLRDERDEHLAERIDWVGLVIAQEAHIARQLPPPGPAAPRRLRRYLPIERTTP